MQPCPACGEKQSLIERLRLARAEYEKAAGKLEGVTTGAFEEPYQRAEEARKLFWAARYALDAHVEKHGC